MFSNNEKELNNNNNENTDSELLSIIRNVYADQENRSLSEVIIAAIEDLICVVDRNYKYIFANKPYTTFSGKSETNIVGLKIIDLLGTDIFFNIVKPNIDKCFAGEIVHYQDWFKELDEEPKYLDVNYYPVYENKTVKYVVINTKNITSIQEAKEAVEESERLFREMFEKHSSIKLLIDPLDNGKIVEANSAACRYYNYSREQMLEKCITDFNVLPKYIIQENMKNALETKKNYFQFQHQLSTGEIRDVEVYSHILNYKGKKLLHSIIHDITDRKNSERKQAEFLSDFSFLNQCGTKLINFKTAGKIYKYVGKKLNSKLENAYIILNTFEKGNQLKIKKVFGFDKKLREKVKNILGFQLLEKDFQVDEVAYSIFKTGKIEEFPGGLFALAEGQIPNYILKSLKNFLRIDKLYLIGLLVDEQLVAGYQIYLKENAQINKYLIESLFNIASSVLKRVDTENRLLEAKIDAEKANRTQSRFLANITHEIRTPMSAILGFVELMKEEECSENMLAYIDTIEKNSKNLLMMFDNILDLSKLDSGNLVLQEKKVNLKKLIDEIISIFTLKITKKQLDFIIEIGKGVPDIIIVDDMKLRQILINLLENAYKFTEKGFIILKIHSKPSRKDKINLLITVKDTGIGIKESEKNKIFFPFVQQNAEKYNGTGLGLTIIQKIIKLMNGTIEVNSKFGFETTFIINIPDIKVIKQSELKSDKNYDETEKDAKNKIDLFIVKNVSIVYDKQKLSNLVNELSETYYETWEKVCNSRNIDEIENFALALKELSNKYEIDVISKYSSDLISSARNFDIEKIKDLLNEYPKMIASFKQILKQIEV